MQDQIWLTTEEAATYLRLKERKLYELVGQSAVPCTKVSGKWLFPRAGLDRWLEAGLSRPAGFDAVPPPPIVGGSQDLLLELAIRESGCGLALLAEGSQAGSTGSSATRSPSPRCTCMRHRTMMPPISPRSTPNPLCMTRW